MNTKIVYYICNFLQKLIEFPYINENGENYNQFIPSQNYTCITLVKISEWNSIMISNYKLDLYVCGSKYN